MKTIMISIILFFSLLQEKIPNCSLIQDCFTNTEFIKKLNLNDKKIIYLSSNSYCEFNKILHKNLEIKTLKATDNINSKNIFEIKKLSSDLLIVYYISENIEIEVMKQNDNLTFRYLEK